MNMKIKRNNTKGITLVTLSIAIIVLLILAGIAVYSGKETIKKAKLEEMKTNMLLIKAKARECVEEANFKLGVNFDSSTEEGLTKLEEVRSEIYVENAGLEKVANLTNVNIPNEVPNGDNVYYITKETMKKWGLDKIQLEEGEVYLIEFNDTKSDEIGVEIYNNIGFDNKYSLTDIEQIQ